MRALRSALFLVIFISTLCVSFISSAYASGVHETGHSAIEFRLDSAHVKMNILPETYVKEHDPEVTLEMTNYMTGSPVLSAEVYILFEEAEKKEVHQAHTGHEMPPPSTDAVTEDEGLDFGESPHMTMGTDLSMFSKLQPQQKAGTYAVIYPLREEGEYSFTLALKSLDGKIFAEPLVFGGSLIYKEASNASLYRMLSVMGIILFSGLSGIWIVSRRKSLNMDAGQKMNVLDIPSVKRFLKSAWFQPVFQIPMLIFFVIIIIAGLFDTQMGDRNIATLLMWTVWWAGIIFTFVFFG